MGEIFIKRVWLKNLPFQLIHNNEIYCCHGTPESDTDYLLEDLQADHIAVKSDEKLDEVLKDLEYKIIVCGHSHVSRIVKTSKRTIVNPGSAGLPAYDDELPIPHKMESFTPYTKYSILTSFGSYINIDQVSISYDYEAAAEMADKNTKEIEIISNKLMENTSENGAFLSEIFIPSAFGGNNKAEWNWIICDFPLITEALIRFGYANENRVLKSVEINFLV